jgi:uncharacterized protein (TIGR02001 family)
MTLGAATSASAQVAGGLTLQNDYRSRGYSLSGTKTVAVADISYDHASGVYLNGSVIGGHDARNDLAVLGVIENVGYARRISSRLTLDGGVVHSEYFERYGPNSTGRYTEAYVGLATRDLSARIGYSPDYFQHGAKTLYSELNGGLDTIASLRLNAHLGYLSCLDMPDGRRCSGHYDWRLGVSRQIRKLELHAAVSGVQPGGRFRPDPALVFGASWVF